VIAFNEAGVRKLKTRYCSYYEKTRTHLALDKDAPVPRPVMRPGAGDIVVIPAVGGLHHRYERRAA
jgi:putative transposase